MLHLNTFNHPRLSLTDSTSLHPPPCQLPQLARRRHREETGGYGSDITKETRGRPRVSPTPLPPPPPPLKYLPSPPLLPTHQSPRDTCHLSPSQIQSVGWGRNGEGSVTGPVPFESTAISPATRSSRGGGWTPRRPRLPPASACPYKRTPDSS